MRKTAKATIYNTVSSCLDKSRQLIFVPGKTIDSSMDEKILRENIIKALENQGFKITPKVSPIAFDKKIYRQIQIKAKYEYLVSSKQFLLNNIDKIKTYCRDARQIEPDKISLELREVKPNSLEAVIFRWWNLVWWSMPYQHPFGRQMRFILWDKTHESVFGLILLQSPILKTSVRDKYLEIPKEELDLWVNKSMYAQRVGALPPYNELLGGKMVALALTSNEVRETYKRKYAKTQTLIERRFIDPDLLFITTTSAFGKSSIYNRLKYKGELVAKSLGYTKGSGTFHIPEELYQEILKFLSDKGVDILRGYGHGPSRKLKLISQAFNLLGLKGFEYHGIKREFYLFPLVKNLKEVIKHKQEPVYINRQFNDLVEFYKNRWAIPRAERKPQWREFNAEYFFKETKKYLKGL